MIALKVKTIFKWSIFSVLTGLLVVTHLWAKEVELKQKAIEEFKNERYPEAISLLKKAASENPNYAETWYYLGYFTHYLCADWIPLTECDEKKSDEILKYLNRAITLDPKHGNAYYFIGVEHGCRFLKAMQKGDIKKMRMELQTGRQKGGYPDWLIEYTRNMLRSCQPNAILFTGGDADSWPTWYLQFCENYRTDVTVIPTGLLTRPWFVLSLKNGIKKALVNIPISWSKEQIMDMHPYRWKTYTVKIPIPGTVLERYNILSQDSLMNWDLKPTLKTSSRELLDTGRAILADIIKTNRWKKPIYFSLAFPMKKLPNLAKFMQLCGLTYRLLPVEVEKHNLSLNPKEIENVLLRSEYYRYFADVKKHNMPRVSRTLNNYRLVLLHLAEYYVESGDNKKAADILDRMSTYMPKDIFPPPNGLKNMTEYLRNNIKVKNR